MRTSSWFILAAVVAINVAAWSWLGRTADGPSWTRPMQGVAYNPSGVRDNPANAHSLSATEIDLDLALLDRQFAHVRTYGTSNDLDLVPYIARRHGLDVSLGAWLQPSEAANEAEIERLIEAANDNSNVTAVVIGNETLLREDLSPDQVIAWLDRVQREVRADVATAEPWHVWLAHPELAGSVDFLAVHILPYWEGVAVEDAIAFLDAQVKALRQTFPGKRIVLTEVGWPSDGVVIGEAVPSPANQAMFLRAFVNYAERAGVEYYLLEAFDQPWKVAIEGSPGAYWGLFDAERQPKFAWAGGVQDLATWPVLALVTAVLGAAAGFAFLRRAAAMRFGGRAAFAGLLMATSGIAVWTGHVALARYLTTWSALGWLMVAVAFGLLLAVLLIEAFEWFDVRWHGRPARAFAAPPVARGPLPRVSIHVPICNEPPEMVADTLRALDRLDYPSFEVLVIDNNTKDPAVWRPVEEFCARLGERFRFVHIEHCPGFKAGALNHALRLTDPEAELVAVIDSDYIVEPDWLRDMAPHFERPEVAFVQGPQDYRDGNDSLFKRMCFWEYAGFFRIGMVQRNERNAIIQHGTMTIMRRTALEGVGGWAEWCITEDAELGLRFFEQGWESVYSARSYGRGVTPDDFGAYKRQRFRWAYGAVQIVKRHAWSLLLPGRTRLDARQRYQFLAGWAPWFADGLNTIFTLLGIIWSVRAIFFVKVFDFPFVLAIGVAVVFFGFKVAKTVALYRARVACTPLEILGASVAGLALSLTVAKAMFLGLVTSNKPFLRTPKCADQPALVRAFAAVAEETILMVLVLLAAAGVVWQHGDDGLVPLLWASFLVIQALPLGAAIALSVIATLPARRQMVPVAAAADEPVRA